MKITAEMRKAADTLERVARLYHLSSNPSETELMSITDSVIRQILPKREGRWGWIDGTVSTNAQTGNPIKLEIEPGEVIPLSVEDALQVGLALLAAVIECEEPK